MYHSVTFGSMNTFSDWHLVPDSRPVVAMPERKIVTVEVPGSNGILDLSESLTGYPVYNNRQGTMKFHVLNDMESWERIYERMSNYIHGKKTTMTLEDDPEYYYEGRYTVKWTSNNDGTWSDVEIGYDLEPFKYFYLTSVQEDPSFYKGIVASNTAKTLDFSKEYTIGTVPVIPEFVMSNVSGSGTTLAFVNAELNINKTVAITSNGNRKYYDMVISNISGGNTCTLTISGTGTVNVVFRRMSL